jgi:CBS domain-containing protein
MVGSGLMTVEEIGVVRYTPILKQGLPNVHVRDVMTRTPETVTPDTPVSRVLEILIDRTTPLCRWSTPSEG